ncbi:MAG: hypothetical protein P8X76_12085 [Maritimibacter sp.]
MGKTNGLYLAGFLVALFGVLLGLSLAKGGLYIGAFEGDTLHLMQIVMREARGQWPHLDFQTPIGVMATAPIVLFLWLGTGAGHAFLYAQGFMALIALPAIWWVSVSRFRGAQSYLFGGFVLALILALIYGGTERSISISMHYNRWAWAFSYLAIALAMMPRSDGRRVSAPEGAVIGIALAMLALIKVTFFAAFILPIMIALIGRRAWPALLVSVATGLLVALIVTLLAGTPNFWQAYLQDLLLVSHSAVRVQPGYSLATTIGAPVFIGGSLALIAGVIALRQAGAQLEGLVLLLLVPGFFYVTYQNYGNDPQWLILFGLIILGLRPAQILRNGLGWDLRAGMGVLAVMALSFALPSLTNILFSPFRHFGSEEAKFETFFPGNPIFADFMGYTSRSRRVRATIDLDAPGAVFAAYADEGEQSEITTWQGEPLPSCKIDPGYISLNLMIRDALEAAGVAADATLYTADVVGGLWLYGYTEPLPGAAPWYYGGLPGFDGADYLVVPLCPILDKARRLNLEAIEESGAALTEITRNEVFILYAKSGAGNS